jgi:hypothetical protein
MLCKIAILEQGSNTMHVYYQKLQSFNGLNPDIQAKIKYIPHSIIGIYARACTFEKHIHEETLDPL